jgi:hypothetical protein
VISVDTKKKEVMGNLANKGQEYRPKGEPVRVDVHDFPDPALGKAVPLQRGPVESRDGCGFTNERWP